MAQPAKSGQTPRPGRGQRTDKTARDRDAQAKAAEKEQQEAAARMSVATAEAAIPNDVVDYTGEGVTDDEQRLVGAEAVSTADPTVHPEPAQEEEVADLTGPEGGSTVPTPEQVLAETVQREDPGLRPATEIVRPVEDTRFVYGTSSKVYEFSAGRAAKVPADVAAHMREKQLIY